MTEQEAREIAQEAKEQAQRAAADLRRHEAECALRYAMLQEHLTRLTDRQERLLSSLARVGWGVALLFVAALLDMLSGAGGLSTLLGLLAGAP